MEHESDKTSKTSFNVTVKNYCVRKGLSMRIHENDSSAIY
jgi:hypothetical protein